ncbi:MULTISPECIES: DsrH/TusB family sulfur metabolism protein [unclassified Acinetobacter]|uniref:DsrH/TusB family sulfur metabolism protein n=1 Tax=unclassified Acinetobacter TaxID=196816 RepID=UPI002934A1AF|nr:MULTISPECIES: DsrH/TusB family sulfur metabolism protein [unclassified Acinetobacter]WOE32090.1 DsrH/TusB family sulfur metabolism protein [Acinetobacter sp. SAAs470]WOE37559.1 DsrH/TusB family sulfur metabolism protein [Acinetobacter sp. SAAs474]
MSNLFLIQSNFAATPQALLKLQSLYSDNDQIVLMGDAVQFVHHFFLQQLKAIYILQNDSDLLLNLNPHNLHVIEYHAFAELCLQHQRCISLK